MVTKSDPPFELKRTSNGGWVPGGERNFRKDRFQGKNGTSREDVLQQFVNALACPNCWPLRRPTA